MTLLSDDQWADLYALAVRVARVVTGDLALAEDVAGDTCVALFERHHVQGSAHVRGWVSTVAYRKAIDEYRRRRRTGPEPPDHALPAPDDVEAEVVGADMASLVEGLLPPDLWSVWELRYVEGHGDREVAERLGLARGTVRNRLTSARKLLKRELGLESAPAGGEGPDGD